MRCEAVADVRGERLDNSPSSVPFACGMHPQAHETLCPVSQSSPSASRGRCVSRDKPSSESTPVIDTVSKDAPPDKVRRRVADPLGAAPPTLVAGPG